MALGDQSPVPATPEPASDQASKSESNADSKAVGSFEARNKLGVLYQVLMRQTFIDGLPAELLLFLEDGSPVQYVAHHLYEVGSDQLTTDDPAAP